MRRAKLKNPLKIQQQQSYLFNCDEFTKCSEMLDSVKSGYDKLHGNNAGKGVKAVTTHVSFPVNGGVGIDIYDFFDIKTNKGLGGGSF